MMRHFIRSLTLALCLGLPAAQSADAAVADGIATAGRAALVSPIEDAQYVYGGANYCWYANGWRGPGYYRCGYAFRTGLGWGGGYGWNGWRGGRGGVVVRGGGYRGGFHGGYHGGGRGGFHGGGGRGGFHGGGRGGHGGGRRR